MRENALRGQADDLKSELKAKSNIILKATKANGTHWRETFCGGGDTSCEATHSIGWVSGVES